MPQGIGYPPGQNPAGGAPVNPGPTRLPAASPRDPTPSPVQGSDLSPEEIGVVNTVLTNPRIMNALAEILMAGGDAAVTGGANVPGDPSVLASQLFGPPSA